MVLLYNTEFFCLFRIAQPSQLYFSGDVKGEAAMKTEKDIGSAMTHQFRVSVRKSCLFIYTCSSAGRRMINLAIQLKLLKCYI